MNGGADTGELRKRPRRYPRVWLRLLYAIEWVFEYPLRGRRWYRRRSLSERSLRVVEREVALDRLPAALDGTRILHLSDFHAGPFLDAGSLDVVIRAARSTSPDLVVFTGDYITHRADEGVALADALGAIRGKASSFAVFGNHDYRERREGEMATAFGARGIDVLRNRGVRIERGDGAGLFVAGIEDVEEGKVVDLDRALAGRRPGDVTLLLAHHPSVVDRLRGRGVDLVMSGHTHGGQVVAFGRGLLGSSLRSRYRVGLFDVDGTHLHVTSGVGVLILPLRVGAPAEVSVVVLRRGAGRPG